MKSEAAQRRLKPTQSNLELADTPVSEGALAQFMPNKDEIFMLAIPWIGGAATIVFWVLGQMGFEWPFDQKIELLNGLIFLDHIHVVFSIPMILVIPELRKWGKSNQVGSPYGWDRGISPFKRIAIVGLALGAIFWILQFSHLATLRGMATLFFLFELLGPDQHLVAQMRGISQFYNSTIRKSFGFNEAELKQALKCEKIERFLFKALLAGELLYWCPEIFELDKFNIPGIGSAQFVGGILAIMAAAGLIVNSLNFPKQEKSRKTAFISRVMCLPLKMLSPIGGLAVRAMHGTEYTMMLRKMIHGSSANQAKKTHAFRWIFIISLVYLGVYALSWRNLLQEYTGWNISDLFYAWAFMTTFVVRFLHFYIDSMMFKMSDPATRAAMGPLMANSK